MNMRLDVRACLLVPVLVLALLPAKVSAQTAAAADVPATAKRPKICLVLSGGGARGAAHIGVLKVLEEYRVPIHCIAGTSMGALVGAGYASGQSVAELEQISGGISTERLFKEKPPRQELSMRRKIDDYRNFIGPEFGVTKGGLTFGPGLVSGVQLETVLREISRVKGYVKFDNLPIPYRAVATDLVTGKAVVFKEGDLPSVMRASMSVPGAVAPAEYEGKLLVDGMLTGNLPVETARGMGADVIIAVNVGTPLLTRAQLSGIFGVAGQMLSILTEQNVQTSLAAMKPTDILISPELGDYSTGDFDSLAKIIPLGDEAARKVADRLKDFSVPVAEFAALRQRQMIAVAPDLRPVDEIRFDGLGRVNPLAVETVMQTKVDEPLVQGKVDQDMLRLYGTGYFEHVNYSLLEETSRRVMAVDAIEKSWGPDFLRFGLGLSSDFRNEAYYNLLGSYRKTWINSLGAEWRTDVQLGNNSNIVTEFYQPLNAKGLLFVAPYMVFGRRTTDVYQGSNLVARYMNASSLVGVDIGSQLFQYGQVRVGVVGGSAKPSLSIGPPSLAPPQSPARQGAYTARLLFDQLDSIDFPRAGWRTGLKIYDSSKQLGAADIYTKWEADGTAAYSFDANSVSVTVKGGGRQGPGQLPSYDQFQWGGFLQQSGYATGQLIGQRLSFARAVYMRRFARGFLFDGVFGGFSVEAGEMGQQLVTGNPTGLLKSGSLFMAADTPIGPVYLAYGRAQAGVSSYYVYLGKPF